jgi:hypothetical protein
MAASTLPRPAVIDPDRWGIRNPAREAYGVWRTTDNGATWEQVFTPMSAGTSEREEIALTRNSGATRIFLANGVSGNGTPGFASFNLCQGQCNYDLFVEVDPRNPDTVWFGGSMVYEEIRPLQDQSLIGVAPNRSIGRAVMRSTDAGSGCPTCRGASSTSTPGWPRSSSSRSASTRATPTAS